VDRACRDAEAVRSGVLTSTSEGVLLAVRVVPRAARAGLAGTREDALLVRLNSAPVDGAANSELIEVLSDALGVPKRAVSISVGERSRRKTVLIRGLSADEVAGKIR
jgi:uncharacterized protein